MKNLLCLILLFTVSSNSKQIYPQYFLDFNSGSEGLVFDDIGIPLVNYSEPIGLQYNPLTIAQYALALYQKYYDESNEDFKDLFMIQANWLVNNINQKNGYGVWEYYFDWETYGMKAPFCSAMAQGLGVSVLIRAYNLSRDVFFLNLMDLAVNAFEVEMNDGGLRYTEYDGSIWFEEYADIDAENSKVLNGFIFSLFGLYEAIPFNSKAETFFWQGIKTLTTNLHRYDAKNKSYYDLKGNTASLNYHKLLIEQLKILYELTSNQIFAEYQELFDSYVDSYPSSTIQETPLFSFEYWLIVFGLVYGFFVLKWFIKHKKTIKK